MKTYLAIEDDSLKTRLFPFVPYRKCTILLALSRTALPVLFLLLALSSRAASVVGTSGDTKLYGTYEIEFQESNISGNRFIQFVSLSFTKGSRTLTIDGFYDGGNTWRARFMPDESGTWTYTWSFNGSSGSGSFSCSSTPVYAQAYGHVRMDANNQRYMVYGNGKPYYAVGGKWIHATSYGPTTKGGQANPPTNGGDGYYTNKILTDYLSALASANHNTLLIKNSLYPLENDKVSWDVAWVKRGEWLVREAAKRGIYCQMGFFDTWSRGPAQYFSSVTLGSDQVFNVWKSGDEAAKENYIRTIIARYSGYYNVYWELGNEMEHTNSGSDFQTLAQSKYLPWMRKYDAYDLPIGLSERNLGSSTSGVDIIFSHQTTELPSASQSRAQMANELVRGGDCGGGLYGDDAIRNSCARFSYRRTFWQMFTYGGVGSFEATKLNLNSSLNGAVQDVMNDHGFLASFINALPVNINQMTSYSSAHVKNGPAGISTRSLPGKVYVSYFVKSSSAGTVDLSLPSGSYTVQWINPSTGKVQTESTLASGGSSVSVAHPSWSQDMVLYVNATEGGSQPPTTPSDRNAFATIEAESLNAQQGLKVVSNLFGYFDQGDWAKYTAVNFGSGATSVDLRVAVDNASAGKTIELRIDSPTGTLIGSHVVKGTGGWSSYQTQTASVKVSGVHDLYLVGKGGEAIGNLDWLVFKTSSTPPTTPTLAKIEAERASANQGVTINSSVISYFDAGDWLKYDAINFGGGVVSVDFFLASKTTGRSIELRLDSPTGTLVGVLNVTSTGDWNGYQVQSARISGASGVHDLYLVGQGDEGIANVDWLRFNSAAASAAVSNLSNARLAEEGNDAVTLYPNPVQDGRLHIRLDEPTVARITVYSLLGKKVLEKEVAPQEDLLLPTLPSGVYTVHIETNAKSYTREVMVGNQP